MDISKPLSFMAACRDYFGLHHGQTAMQFGAEIKKLTEEDRAEIKLGLEKLGYTITN